MRVILSVRPWVALRPAFSCCAGFALAITSDSFEYAQIGYLLLKRRFLLSTQPFCFLHIDRDKSNGTAGLAASDDRHVRGNDRRDLRIASGRLVVDHQKYRLACTRD